MARGGAGGARGARLPSGFPREPQPEPRRLAPTVPPGVLSVETPGAGSARSAGPPRGKAQRGLPSVEEELKRMKREMGK